MNRTLYGNLIFELSKKGRKGTPFRRIMIAHTPQPSFPQHFAERKLQGYLNATS